MAQRWHRQGYARHRAMSRTRAGESVDPSKAVSELVLTELERGG